MFSIIGFSITFIKSMLLLNSIEIFLKKLVSYKFFKILFKLSLSKSSLIETSENNFIVSLEIRSFPVISILFTISDRTG